MFIALTFLPYHTHLTSTPPSTYHVYPCPTLLYLTLPHHTLTLPSLPEYVGSGIQEWHVDDSMAQPKRPRYFTVLINLNPLDAYCGGTEVWIDALKKGDLVRRSVCYVR